MTNSPDTPDDRLLLGALGGVAYLLSLMLHEGLGHAVICAWIGGHPVITSTATQCERQSLGLVLAGPLLNLVGGLAAWLVVRGMSPARPRAFWLTWLLMAMNLFLFAGYLAFCGLLGFGDWDVLAQGVGLPWVWRPLAVLVGAALYYGALRVVAAQLPPLAGDPSAAVGKRLSTLTLYPYLGAGIVACLAGLLSPLPYMQSLILPAASSFGAYFGLLLMGSFRREATADEKSNRGLGPIARSPTWLGLALVTIAAFVGLVGPGLRLPR